MSSKRVRIILLTGIVLIAAIIGIGLNIGNDQTTDFILPQSESDAPTGAGPTASSAPSGGGLNNVTVSPGNVQAVIETMQRPDSYSRSIKVENFYDNDSAVYNIGVSVLKGAAAIVVSGADTKKYIVLANGQLYIWYDSDKENRAVPADVLGENKESSDQLQMLLTYEDVLALDKSSILDAGFTTYQGESCIDVKYVSGQLQYTTVCHISAATGLLIGAEQYDGAALVYRMSTSGYNSAEPAESAFKLPDGKNALSAP